MVISRRTPMADWPGRIYASLLKPALGLLTAAVLLTAVFAPDAEARAIRFDFGDSWTDPVPWGSFWGSQTVNVGFELDGDSTARISPFGSLRLGGLDFYPFLSNEQHHWMWQKTTGPLEDTYQAGFRVCWGCATGGNGVPDQDKIDTSVINPFNTSPINRTVMEVGIFDLGLGRFYFEFNYNAVRDEDGLEISRIGFENTDFRDFVDKIFFGDRSQCESNQDLILACASNRDDSWFDGLDETGYFSNAQGRFAFTATYEQPRPVPEPGTGALLLLGLGALGAFRRRQATAKVI